MPHLILNYVNKVFVTIKEKTGSTCPGLPVRPSMILIMSPYSFDYKNVHNPLRLNLNMGPINSPINSQLLSIRTVFYILLLCVC